MKTATFQGPPPSVGTVDNPKCTCCTPGQPLAPPVGNETEYTCPVKGKKYSFDPGEGVVREVVAQNNATTSTTQDDGGWFPASPKPEQVQQINPEDPFA